MNYDLNQKYDDHLKITKFRAIVQTDAQVQRHDRVEAASGSGPGPATTTAAAAAAPRATACSLSSWHLRRLSALCCLSPRHISLQVCQPEDRQETKGKQKDQELDLELQQLESETSNETNRRRWLVC